MGEGTLEPSVGFQGPSYLLRNVREVSRRDREDRTAHISQADRNCNWLALARLLIPTRNIMVANGKLKLGGRRCRGMYPECAADIIWMAANDGSEFGTVSIEESIICQLKSALRVIEGDEHT